MKYLSAKETAKKWNISMRSVRNYCAQGRIPGAFLTGKTWNIPEDAEKPARLVTFNESDSLLDILIKEQTHHVENGLYHRIATELTYGGISVTGNTLTKAQISGIVAGAIPAGPTELQMVEILDAVNYLHCVDMMLERIRLPLTERHIKHLHASLCATIHSRYIVFDNKDKNPSGDYRTIESEGKHPGIPPQKIPAEMSRLIEEYQSAETKSLEVILDFFCRFTSIRPFGIGNGRIGRLILFRECLRNNITPFVIDASLEAYFNRGVAEWSRDKEYLLDTCAAAAETFAQLLAAQDNSAR